MKPTIASLLREYKTRHVLSERELGVAMGCSQGQVSRILHGMIPRTGRVHRGLVKVLGDRVRPLLPGQDLSGPYGAGGRR